ncbi:DNA-binding transcriptional ArsR family regulator [Streptomyces aurantiacus]|uniref:ArsR/SmtB family transcription factor n=1 Tax=Streptomyces aurantiacus TaxID=47760 RepID=UPI00279073EB|nr:DUF5937 family protein [Streptomyces aurantiacus]MDQ0774444.1 DNA-binding transcriptional ArsR family regulator [Streptomyces aurantiacus]
MPFHLDFGEEDLLNCRFALSPLWETHEAVRTLRRPARQGYHSAWLRRIRTAAAALDLEPLWLLMPYRGNSPDCLMPPPIGPAATFEEEIAAVRGTGPEVARAEIALSLADTPGATESPLGRALLADPARAVRELADTMEAAWHALVEPAWPRLRALLEADIAFRSRRLAEVGLAGLLPGLDRRVAWDGGRLTVDWKGEHVRELGGRGLVLMPSVFTWPDVVSGFDPPWQPTLVYPARGIGGLWAEPSSRTPEALVRLLGRGRAAVLAALEEPAATTALAQRLGLAPSSVSAHLSALRDAGLLASHRYGHQVLYERTPLGIALASGGEGA